MVLIGNCTPEEEHIITLLRAGTLIQDIWSRKRNTKVEIGIDALVRAIGLLNDKAEERLVKAFIGVPQKACLKEEGLALNCIPYCEDERLSLQYFGTTYKSIAIPADTPTISEESRQMLLDTLCCFFNMDHAKPKNSGALRNAWMRAKQAQEDHQEKIFREEEEMQAMEGRFDSMHI